MSTRTLFVDSSYAEVDSTGSRFVLDLGGNAIELPKGSKVYVDDVCLHNTFKSVETSENDRLYVVAENCSNRIWTGTWDFSDPVLPLGDNLLAQATWDVQVGTGNVETQYDGADLRAYVGAVFVRRLVVDVAQNSVTSLDRDYEDTWNIHSPSPVGPLVGTNALAWDSASDPVWQGSTHHMYLLPEGDTLLLREDGEVGAYYDQTTDYATRSYTDQNGDLIVVARSATWGEYSFTRNGLAAGSGAGTLTTFTRNEGGPYEGTLSGSVITFTDSPTVWTAAAPPQLRQRAHRLGGFDVLGTVYESDSRPIQCID